MKKFVVLQLLLLVSTLTFGQAYFTKKEVIEDLEYLKSSLENTHYNLFAYQTKETFDKHYKEVKASIKQDSFSLLEATSLFQSIISKVNNGHTEISFPVSAYIQYAEKGGTLFPLELAFENGKALIRKNFSSNNKLPIGAELISINGLKINQVLATIFPLISAERTYFKLAKLELFSFPRYYWQAFGEQKSYKVKIKNKGVIQEFILEPIKLIDDFEMKREDIAFSRRELSFNNGIAYLIPGNFSGDEVQYKRFIDSVFIEIKKRNASELILDLRNNLGGDNALSDYLVAYIADQPFYWNSEFSLKTSDILKEHVRKNYDTLNPYWAEVLAHKSGSHYFYTYDAYPPQPINKRFTGNVYVLINRQSHSQSAVTAAQIQDYKWATIIGEETGDFPSLYASQYTYYLPKTNVEVKVSKGYIVRVSGSKKPEGVMPDVYIQDHLLDSQDEVLEGAIRLIQDRK